MQENERENAKYLHFESRYVIFTRILFREMNETLV